MTLIENNWIQNIGLKLVPVAKAVPPEAALYQIKLPILEAAFNVIIPAPQRLTGVVEVTVGIALTVAVIAVLTDETHVPFTPST